jgi:hypothetical protein
MTVKVQENVAGLEPALSLKVKVSGNGPGTGGVPVMLMLAPDEELSDNHDGPDKAQLYGGLPPVAFMGNEKRAPWIKAVAGQLALICRLGGGGFTIRVHENVAGFVITLSFTVTEKG